MGLRAASEGPRPGPGFAGRLRLGPGAPSRLVGARTSLRGHRRRPDPSGSASYVVHARAQMWRIRAPPKVPALSAVHTTRAAWRTSLQVVASATTSPTVFP
jgi:hypothetical protein